MQISIRIPPVLRDAIKRQANDQGRSINTHVVMIIREATKEAAGGDLAGQTPAAGNDNAALAGGASITQGIGGAANE